MSQIKLNFQKRPRLWRAGLIFPAALLTGAIILVITLTQPAQAAPPAQAPDAPPSVVGGRALWSENCLPCHGPGGQGDGPTAQSIPGPLPNFADVEKARQYVPVDNFEVIKNGRMDKMMPPWKNQLTDAEIWDAVAYVWQLGTPSQNLVTGETVYAAQCASCHGPDGRGLGADAPAEINDFTDLASMAQKSQADLWAGFQASDQHDDLGQLSEADLWASLDYARTFSFVLPARNGVLSGQVLKVGTNEPVSNVPVTLHAFQDNAELESFTTQTDENGFYSFDKLLTEHTIMYVVEGTYQGVVYVSQEPGMFLPESSETTLDLEVYDTTGSDAAIDITQMHYLLSFSPNVVNILQIFIVGNEGDKTYIGQNGQTFSFDLPEGATNVTFQNDPGDRFIKTAAGYADTEPVMPGEEGLTIALLYDVPYEDDTLSITFPASFDIGSFDVLMTNQGAELNSDQVEFVESREFQGNEFAVYTGKNIGESETIRLNLTGLDDLVFEPAAGSVIASTSTISTTWFNQELARWIIVGLGALVVATVVFVYPKARPRLTHQTTTPSEDPETQRKKLLLTLAHLDEVYENGELDEEVYRRARAKYKAELAQVLELT